MRDRLDFELNLERRMSSLNTVACRPHRSGHKYDPDLVRVKGKICHDEYYSDGGQCTTWITDGSSASNWDRNEKENIPSPPRSHRFHPYARSPQPPSAPRAPHSPVYNTSSRFHSTSPVKHHSFSPTERGSGSVLQHVKSCMRPSSSVNFPAPSRCMKPNFFGGPTASQEVLKPQHHKHVTRPSVSTSVLGTSTAVVSLSPSLTAPATVSGSSTIAGPSFITKASTTSES